MAETLSFGFQVPEDGDPASTWQPAIETSLRQLNDHTHDGVNSSTISPASITTLTSPVSATIGAGAGEWTHDGFGTYDQEVIAPGAIAEVNNFFPKVYINAAPNEMLSLSVERVSASTIKLFTNNPVAMTVVWR